MRMVRIKNRDQNELSENGFNLDYAPDQLSGH
jgi:hypothetical protein